MKTIGNFLEESKEIVNKFNDFILENDLDNNLKNICLVDHICYKCESSQSFEEWRKVFENNSKFIYQAIIAERRIVLVGFLEPIKTVLGDINYLELSDQKPDNSQKESFDHIEILSKDHKNKGSYEDFVKIFDKLKNEGVIKMKKTERPHHTTFDIELGKYNVG